FLAFACFALRTSALAISFTPIPPLPGDSEVEVHYLSENGVAVIGYSAPSFDWPIDETSRRAFYWSAATGTREIAKLPGTNGIQVSTISFDGTVISGTCYTVTESEPYGSPRAFRWTSTSGTQSLGNFSINSTLCQSV